VWKLLQNKPIVGGLVTKLGAKLASFSPTAAIGGAIVSGAGTFPGWGSFLSAKKKCQEYTSVTGRA